MKLVAIETANKVKPKAEVVELFKARMQQKRVHKYNKFGTVKARPAKTGEKIDTIIKGVKETTNTANAGDQVVKNRGGEEYIISGKKFDDRYKLNKKLEDGWSEYSATGSCWAFKYEGPPFSFDAPWGEMMLVETNDYIAVADIKNLDDIYRIEQEAFANTYKKA